MTGKFSKRSTRPFRARWVNNLWISCDICRIRPCISQCKTLKKPLFYSLPPAGQKIPLKALARCLTVKSRDTRDRSIEIIKRYLGTDHVFFLSSGRAALWLYLKTVSSMKPARKEVIVPAYTCPSVVSAVLKAGLTPVLCDNNVDDFGFLCEELEEKLNKKTLAVIVVHLYGMPVRLEKIQALCRGSDTWLVEDAAQSFGGSFPGNPDVKLGLAGDAGFFSFGRGKPISILHGGLLTVKSRDIHGEALNLYGRMNGASSFQSVNYCLSLGLYSLFSNPWLYWFPQRIPALNLGGTVFEPEFEITSGNSLAMSLVCEMIDSVEKEKRVREDNSRWYFNNLQEFQWAGIRPAPVYPYLRYPLLVTDGGVRNRILESLVSAGTGATGSYPTPLNMLPGLKEVLADEKVYKDAKQISASIVTLPVHSGVTEKDRENIKRIIAQASHAN